MRRRASAVEHRKWPLSLAWREVENITRLEHNGLRFPVATTGELRKMLIELFNFRTLRIDIMAGKYDIQAQPVCRHGAFAWAHFRSQHSARHWKTVENFLRIRDADATDIRFVEFALKLHVAKNRRVPIMIKANAG